VLYKLIHEMLLLLDFVLCFSIIALQLFSLFWRFIVVLHLKFCLIIVDCCVAFADCVYLFSVCIFYCCVGAFVATPSFVEVVSMLNLLITFLLIVVLLSAYLFSSVDSRVMVFAAPLAHCICLPICAHVVVVIL